MKPFGRRPQLKRMPEQTSAFEDYWSIEAEKLITALQSTNEGISQTEAAIRLQRYGMNSLETKKRTSTFGLLLSQFKSPLVLILIFASIISAFVGEWTDAAIVLAVVIGSTTLGFVQEYRAGNAVEKLRSQVTIKANVLRDGKPNIIPSEQVVPGDIVLLSAGSLIPADGIVLETKDFFVNQAVLTGETYPNGKKPGGCLSKSQSGRTHQLCIHGHERKKRHSACIDRANRKGNGFRPDR